MSIENMITIQKKQKKRILARYRKESCDMKIWHDFEENNWCRNDKVIISECFREIEVIESQEVNRNKKKSFIKKEVLHKMYKEGNTHTN